MAQDDTAQQDGASTGGLRRDLSGRQVGMIALGGSIGTGLFLSSGLAINIAGPAVVIAYAIAAFAALALAYALAEMVVVHPEAGGFGPIAQRYLGGLAGFVQRWMYWAAQGVNIGSEVVGEPGAVLRHDLNTPMPGPAREFYPAVFDLVLDRDEDQPELDLTPLRRPDGHEVAGVLATPGAPRSVWTTTFEVADADEAVRLVTEAGGDSDGAHTTVRGRTAVVTDPFGARFALTARAR